MKMSLLMEKVPKFGMESFVDKDVFVHLIMEIYVKTMQELGIHMMKNEMPLYRQNHLIPGY